MNRNVDALASRDWDVLVIGSGISGAGVAWESASRGFKTALVEKGDFGAATSSGCFRIIHGGIRYLQHFDFKRLAESVQEQRALRRSAPHLVHPFAFLVPCYGHGKKSRPYIGLGAFLYDFITANRNRGVDEEHNLPHPRILCREEVLRVAPGLPSDGLTGGVVFYDCSVYHCERLSLSVVESAAAAGAQVANYVEAVEFHLENNTPRSGRISRVVVRDLMSGREHEVRARLVVNAAGPWIPVLNKALEEREGTSRFSKKLPPVARERVYSKGVQVVLPSVVEKYAVAIESSQSDYSAIVNRGTRSYFLLPWRGTTLLGTSEQLFSGEPETYAVTKTDVHNLLLDAQRGYKSEVLETKNVKHVFGGLRQLDPNFFTRGQELGEAPPSKIDQLIDYANLGDSDYQLDNLVSVGCVKYTTFRAVAERAVDLISKKLDVQVSKSLTRDALLSGGVADWVRFRKLIGKRFEERFSQSTTLRILSEFGAKAESLANMIDAEPQLGRTLGSTDVTVAEIVLSLRSEMPQTLLDLVMRRTALGVFGFPGDAAVEEASIYCARELGWDNPTREANVQEVKRVLDISWMP